MISLPIQTLPGCILQYKFPKDFKFKGIIELMDDLKKAKDSGASSSTIAAIEDDINEILYSDRPEELKKIKVKNSLNPFRGYSEADIRFIISQNNTPLLNRTIWENMESIFQELEAENENPWLYDMDEKMIREKVRVKTLEYIDKIKAEQKAKEAEQPRYNPFTER